MKRLIFQIDKLNYVMDFNYIPFTNEQIKVNDKQYLVKYRIFNYDTNCLLIKLKELI